MNDPVKVEELSDDQKLKLQQYQNLVDIVPPGTAVPMPSWAKSLVKSKAVDAQVKTVTFSKLEGKKWALAFDGPIKRKDIGTLRLALLVQFNRMKRSARMAKRRLEREVTNTQKKDETNG